MVKECKTTVVHLNMMFFSCIHAKSLPVRTACAFTATLCTENQIYKGLDDEESTFLNFVAERQAEMDARQFEEEMEELKEYRISFSTTASCGWLCKSVVWAMRPYVRI